MFNEMGKLCLVTSFKYQYNLLAICNISLYLASYHTNNYIIISQT